MTHMAKLCVNIDHIATIRNARGGDEPDPLHAAALCELAGAVGITFHLREDRRHIRDADAFAFRRIVKGVLNMEMACTEEMIRIALEITPDQVTLVPEKRAEVTTEGGLNVIANAASVQAATDRLRAAGIAVSLFIDADSEQIEASAACGATHVEFHTGTYANLFDRQNAAALGEARRIRQGCLEAHGAGLVVNAGHGLNYRNTQLIAVLPHMNELNTGHAIIGRAALVGLDRAVRDMVALISNPTELI
jgi:pyridoxine 5-phosphate synthase